MYKTGLREHQRQKVHIHRLENLTPLIFTRIYMFSIAYIKAYGYTLVMWKKLFKFFFSYIFVVITRVKSGSRFSIQLQSRIDEMTK